MAGRADIKAGSAFVELTLKNQAFIKGLRNASQRLKDFGKGVATFGAGMSAAGAAIVAPFAAMTQAFLDLGDQYDKMRQRTGLSVQAISELDHAAGQSAATLEDVEKAVKKMQQQIGKAGEMSQETADALAFLGMTQEQLLAMSPEEQFMTLAHAIGQIQDPTKRAALAMQIFGRAGATLLPMIEDLDALRQEARDLGVTMDGESAAAAVKLGDALANVWKTVKMAGVAVATALAPSLQKAVDVMQGIASAAAKWVKENRELFVMLFKVGLVIMAVGAAITGLGLSLAAAGVVVGGLATGLSALTAIIGAILSPIGLVTAAVAAGVGYWLMYSQAGQATLAALSERIGAFVGEATSAFGAIANALAAGDMKAAGDVLWSYLQLQWARGIAWIGGKWDEFVGFFQDVWATAVFKTASVFLSAWSGVQNFWNNFTTGLMAGWELFTNAAINAWKWLEEKVAKGIAWIMSWFDGTDYNAVAKNITEDYARQRGQRDAASQQRLAEIGQANLDRAAEIDAANRGSQDALKADYERGVASRMRNRQAAVDEAQRRVDEANAAFGAAKDRANAAGEAAAKSDGEKKEAAYSIEANVPSAGKAAQDVFGAFSAAALAAGAGASPDDKAAKAVEKAAKAQEKRDNRLLVAVRGGGLT